MSKKGQIFAVTMAISELCNLIRALQDENYTEEQAAAYYKTIFEIHSIEPEKDDA